MARVGTLHTIQPWRRDEDHIWETAREMSFRLRVAVYRSMSNNRKLARAPLSQFSKLVKYRDFTQNGRLRPKREIAYFHQMNYQAKSSKLGD